MVCQCGGTWKGIKSKVGGELDISLQALFTCVFYVLVIALIPHNLSSNPNTFGPSFRRNLCFKYSNGSCKPILNIYVSSAFQWYKEFFNPMCFDPYNHLLKIWESIETPIPKLGAHLGVCGFIPSHLLHS